MNIIYLGFNSFKTHKRGVENVIDFQASSFNFNIIYYLHWGECTKVYKNNKFICVSIKRCWYWPILLSSIMNKIKNKSNCIIHSHNALFSVFGFFATDIFTVHDALYYQNKSIKNGKLYFWLIEKILYLRCNFVHFISNYTKKQSLFNKNTGYKIIYNSSYLEKYSNIQLDLTTELKQEYVLIVKSVEERSRFDLLIDVAIKLNDVYFVVAGKGPLLEYYQNFIVEYGIKNVQMLGYVDEVSLVNLYINCKVVINIAEYGEGFGLPIIEAYLFNKPVIASNRCAIPEVINSDMFLFENNVNSIIEVYQIALNTPKIDFNSYYKLNFSNDKISKDLNLLYSNLC